MASPSYLAGLLLLLAIFSNALVVILAMPVEYEYHNYVVTPLSSHAYSAPAAGAETEDDVATSSAAAAALHIRMAHRDSFVVNATASELLARRLQRDEQRAAWIISKAAAAPVVNANATRVGSRRLSGGERFMAPLVSGAPTSGEYIAKISVGTPGVETLLAPDTGSDLTWLQCAPCQRCYNQSSPVFDPRRSTSRQDIGYNAPACQALGRSAGDSQRRTCVYTVGYGDGSTTAGDLISETLTFDAFYGPVRLPDLSIGCGHDNRGLFGAPAAGILGLGRGVMSFPNQIAGLGYNRTFSYCLVDMFSSPGSRSSFLVFGAGAGDAYPFASFTPTVRNPNMDTFYYVRLVGVSVAGVRVPGVTERDLKLDPHTGRGGVILDSGTTVTRLARPAYTAFRDAFRAAATDLGRVSAGGPSSFFDTCYTLGGGGARRVKVPALTMHFAGGVEVRLPPKNYLIPVDSKGTVCLAFADTGDRSVSIIGNLQQQGFRIVYDIDGQRVGFSPNNC